MCYRCNLLLFGLTPAATELRPIRSGEGDCWHEIMCKTTRHSRRICHQFAKLKIITVRGFYLVFGVQHGLGKHRHGAACLECVDRCTFSYPFFSFNLSKKTIWKMSTNGKETGPDAVQWGESNVYLRSIFALWFAILNKYNTIKHPSAKLFPTVCTTRHLQVS